MVIILYQVTESAGGKPAISGMTAWKRPKKNAIIKKVRQQMRRMIIPLVMETVKQSIARLMQGAIFLKLSLVKMVICILNCMLLLS